MEIKWQRFDTKNLFVHISSVDVGPTGRSVGRSKLSHHRVATNPRGWASRLDIR